MSPYARVIDGIVIETIILPDGTPIGDAFHPDIASQFVACGEGVVQGWAYDGADFAVPAGPSLSNLKASKASDVDAKIAACLSGGAPVSGGLHVSLDDSSRADMGSMATTALAAIGGAVPWPDSYKQGWISIENMRIPLAAPADGLSLAAGVGDYYAKVRQNGRTLKDAAAAAKKQADLDAVNVDSGWPT